MSPIRLSRAVGLLAFITRTSLSNAISRFTENSSTYGNIVENEPLVPQHIDERRGSPGIGISASATGRWPHRFPLGHALGYTPLDFQVARSVSDADLDLDVIEAEKERVGGRKEQEKADSRIDAAIMQLSDAAKGSAADSSIIIAGRDKKTSRHCARGDRNALILRNFLQFFVFVLPLKSKTDLRSSLYFGASGASNHRWAFKPFPSYFSIFRHFFSVRRPYPDFHRRLLHFECLTNLRLVSCNIEVSV